WLIAASRRSSRSPPSTRSESPTQAILPPVSISEAPTTHTASKATRAPLGSSARRPATTVPSVVPTAATAAQVSATAAIGLRSRHQSTVREGSVAARPGGVLGGSPVVWVRVCVIAVRHYAAAPTRLL